MRVAVVLALSLPVFADVSASPPDLRDYYPTSPGCAWVYAASDGSELESVAQGVQEFEGKFYQVLNLARYFTQDHRTEFVTASRDRITVSAIGGAALPMGRMEPSMTLLQGPLRPGARWVSRGAWVYIDSRCAYELVLEGRVKGRETIRVPAGTFSCWKVELAYTFGSGRTRYPYRRTLWLARGIGIVRQFNEYEDRQEGWIELKHCRR